MSKQISDATFENDVLKSSLPILVDFWAPWCGPCRGVAPILEELSAEYDGKVVIGKVNVDENQVVPAQFGIRAIPTMIMFKNGEAVGQIVGGVGKSDIEAMIAKAL
ncbi:MAG: thioredoxin [Mailhella sp.]|nr:thioredoxin [Mailhella sp.]